MKCLAQVRVLPTHFRTPRGELCVDEGARQSHDASGQPRTENQRWGVHLPRDYVGVDKDAGPNNPAHYDHRRVEQA
jgi:hypothetical protein